MRHAPLHHPLSRFAAIGGALRRSLVAVLLLYFILCINCLRLEYSPHAWGLSDWCHRDLSQDPVFPVCAGVIRIRVNNVVHDLDPRNQKTLVTKPESEDLFLWCLVILCNYICNYNQVSLCSLLDSGRLAIPQG